VNQIADVLDLSKGALYEMIRPLPADLSCPVCGVETVHPNRTAQERGLVVCPACGWEGEDEQAVPLSVPEDAAATVPARARAAAESVRPGLTVPIVIGAAVGVVVFLWAWRRR
jgi:hypothetical protein